MYKDIVLQLKERARANPKRIIFPESQDTRVRLAVDQLRQEKIVEPLLLEMEGVDSFQKDIFANILFERRKSKGLSFQTARDLMDNELFYAAMMVQLGFADGLVAGAANSTANVMRAVITCLDIDPHIGLVTSCFLMGIPDCSYGKDGVLVFSDCGVIPSPDSRQLASIAQASAAFVRDILEIIPRVAMLSFSSKGSARNKDVEKIKEAVEIVKEAYPDFLIDGELQADSALIPEVASLKLKDSNVAGIANVLVFPNLDSGNISYKLIERLARARAIGPILLGTLQPCSDLSRGCSVEDVMDCAVITAIQAQKRSLNFTSINLDKYYASACV